IPVPRAAGPAARAAAAPGRHGTGPRAGRSAPRPIHTPGDIWRRGATSGAYRALASGVADAAASSNDESRPDRAAPLAGRMGGNEPEQLRSPRQPASEQAERLAPSPDQRAWDGLPARGRVLTSRPVLRRSLAVAGLVTAAAGGVLAAALAVSDTLFVHRSSSDLDSEVQSLYLNLNRQPAFMERVLVTGRLPTGLVVWRRDGDRDVTGGAGLPPPLRDAYHRLEGRDTAEFDGITYRLLGGPLADGWLVVGSDAGIVVRPQADILQAQLVTVPPVLLAVFLG